MFKTFIHISQTHMWGTNIFKHEGGEGNHSSAKGSCRLSFYDGMVKIVVMMKRNEDDDDEDDDDDVSKANIFSKASSLEC